MQTEIDKWLDDFCKTWKSQDVDKVLALFTDDVEYWETPFQMFDAKGNVAAAWELVKNQKDIQIVTKVFVSLDSRHTVSWDLRYKNANGEESHWAGVYLITLNKEGLCEYFYQVGEKE